MSREWAGGSTRHWREVVRPTVLARDAYRCKIALPGTWRNRAGVLLRCGVVATCVHHLHGKGRCVGCRHDALDHLVAACTECNLKVGDPGYAHGVSPRNPPPKIMTRWWTSP